MTCLPNICKKSILTAKIIAATLCNIRYDCMKTDCAQNVLRGDGATDAGDARSGRDRRCGLAEAPDVAYFRPLFSLALHVARDGQRLLKQGTPERLSASLAEVEALAASLWRRRRRFDAPAFEQAWFALCAWLDELFGNLPGDRTTSFLERYFPGQRETAGAVFFAQLQAAETAALAGDSGGRVVVALYALCLTYGFRGSYRNNEDTTILKSWRRRCRAALSAPSGREDAIQFSNSHFFPIPESMQRRRRGSRVARFCMTCLLWLFPPSVTVALFVLYRTILAELYASIMG